MVRWPWSRGLRAFCTSCGRRLSDGDVLAAVVGGFLCRCGRPVTDVAVRLDDAIAFIKHHQDTAAIWLLERVLSRLERKAFLEEVLRP